MRTRTSVLIFILALAVNGAANAYEIDWPKVDAALGKTASVQGEVHRYGIPRSDLQVTLDGVARACFGAGRMARLRADPRRCAGHG